MRQAAPTNNPDAVELRRSGFWVPESHGAYAAENEVVCFL